VSLLHRTLDVMVHVMVAGVVRVCRVAQITAPQIAPDDHVSRTETLPSDRAICGDPSCRRFEAVPGTAVRSFPLGRDRPLANGGDAGMSTAEYAVGTVAAVAFAGVLYAVVSSSATRELISSVVERALSVPI
jgi:hypothetical protein